MAHTTDKTAQFAVAGLTQALAEPGGRRLHGRKGSPGLFPTNATARRAARICKDVGYLRSVRSESQGKTTTEICTITDQGVAYLLHRVGVSQLLEQIAAAVDARGQEIGQVLLAAVDCQSTLATMKAHIEKVLATVRQTPPAKTEGSDTWQAAVLSQLADWSKTRSSEDCPLPEIFRRAQNAAPQLSIGVFHDGIRQLYSAGTIHLHPWTGPLSEIPEPAYALLVGHTVAYYASRTNI